MYKDLQKDMEREKKMYKKISRAKKKCRETLQNIYTERS